MSMADWSYSLFGTSSLHPTTHMISHASTTTRTRCCEKRATSSSSEGSSATAAPQLVVPYFRFLRERRIKLLELFQRWERRPSCSLPSSSSDTTTMLYDSDRRERCRRRRQFQFFSLSCVRCFLHSSPPNQSHQDPEIGSRSPNYIRWERREKIIT